MEPFQLLCNLSVPKGRIDAVLDTDTYNEVDDQFALAYMLKSDEKINVKAVYAAPFYNEKSTSPGDGMRKSYDEIIRVLDLAEFGHYRERIFWGSEQYMPDENTPVESDAMHDLIDRAKTYTPKNPLYVVCIGAVTNVASALCAAPEIAENIVIVWLGGHDIHHRLGCREFNMMQDIAAARILFTSKAPLVQLPCAGVVSAFRIAEQEFQFWLKGKNALCDFLVDNVMRAEAHSMGRPWSRIVWDVTAVGWLLNQDGRFMDSVLMPCRIPEYDMRYACDADAKTICYVNEIQRDALLEDLVKKLTK